MVAGKVIDLHEAWRYKTLVGNNIDISGAATFSVCAIYLPYDHVIRKAFFASTDQNNADTDTIQLRKQNIGASASILMSQAATWGDSAGNATRIDLPLLAAFDDVELRGGAIYFLSIVSDAGDNVDSPCLTLLVQPVPPGPA